MSCRAISRHRCAHCVGCRRLRLTGRAPLFLVFALLLSCLASAVHAQSQVFPKWVARYDAVHLFDEPANMAADGKGNVYVTGSACEEEEALTIRVRSAGKGCLESVALFTRTCRLGKTGNGRCCWQRLRPVLDVAGPRPVQHRQQPRSRGRQVQPVRRPPMDQLHPEHVQRDSLCGSDSGQSRR